MTQAAERVCVGCGSTEEAVRLEQCHICGRFFCSECAHRAGYGRRFCSPDCGRAYYFTGEPDDDDDAEPEES
jgi:hypothetical protein